MENQQVHDKREYCIFHCGANTIGGNRLQQKKKKMG